MKPFSWRFVRCLWTVASDERLTLRVACAGRSLGRIETSGAGWEELTFELPADVPTGLQRIEIAAEPGPDAAGAPSDRPEADSGPSFAALHYWSVR